MYIQVLTCIYSYNIQIQLSKKYVVRFFRYVIVFKTITPIRRKWKLYNEHSFVVLIICVSCCVDVDRSYLNSLDFRDFISCESKLLEVFKEVWSPRSADSDAWLTEIRHVHRQQSYDAANCRRTPLQTFTPALSHPNITFFPLVTRPCHTISIPRNNLEEWNRWESGNAIQQWSRWVHIRRKPNQSRLGFNFLT